MWLIIDGDLSCGGRPFGSSKTDLQKSINFLGYPLVQRHIAITKCSKGIIRPSNYSWQHVQTPNKGLFKSVTSPLHSSQQNHVIAYYFMQLSGSSSTECKHIKWHLYMDWERGNWAPLTLRFGALYLNRSIENYDIGLFPSTNWKTCFSHIYLVATTRLPPHCALNFSYKHQSIKIPRTNCDYSETEAMVTCTNEVQTEHFYYYPDTKSSWNTAQKYCQAKSLRLVSTDSPQVLSAIKTILIYLKKDSLTCNPFHFYLKRNPTRNLVGE